MGLGTEGAPIGPECRSTGSLMVLMKSGRCKTQSVVGSRVLCALPDSAALPRFGAMARRDTLSTTSTVPRKSSASQLVVQPPSLGRVDITCTVPSLVVGRWRLATGALLDRWAPKCKRRRSLAAIEARALPPDDDCHLPTGDRGRSRTRAAG